MLRRYLSIAFVSLILAEAMMFPSFSSAETRFQKSVAEYRMPDVWLINQEGKKIRFKQLVEADRPVVVDFIYATCTTICPVLSVGYVNLQSKLTDPKVKPVLVSITIDPENDTPKKMKEYLKRYNARPGWEFLTGTRADIDAVMKAFNAYIPDKMSHYPLNFIRSPKDGKWVRLYGIMSSREFMSEYMSVAGK